MNVIKQLSAILKIRGSSWLKPQKLPFRLSLLQEQKRIILCPNIVISCRNQCQKCTLLPSHNLSLTTWAGEVKAKGWILFEMLLVPVQYFF